MMNEGKTTFEVIEKFKTNSKFKHIEMEFSIYISGGQGITISRKLLRIHIQDVDNSYTIKDLVNVDNDEELGLNSRVYLLGKLRYIPMADLAITDIDKFDKILKLFRKYTKADVYLYFSGRSYHVYAIDLLTFRKWMKFLGELLLLNSPHDDKEYVDARWIGHNLVQGFGTLRLSCNSHYYLQSPQLVGIYNAR